MSTISTEMMELNYVFIVVFGVVLSLSPLPSDSSAFLQLKIFRYSWCHHDGLMAMFHYSHYASSHQSCCFILLQVLLLVVVG